MSSINGYETLNKELDRVRDKTDEQERSISQIREEVAKLQEMYVYHVRELERIGKIVDNNTKKLTIICAIASVVVVILSNLDKIIPFLKGG